MNNSDAYRKALGLADSNSFHEFGNSSLFFEGFIERALLQRRLGSERLGIHFT
jgi:hypothetical protein